jgi:hypothetical protein
MTQLHEGFASSLTHALGAYLRVAFTATLVSAEYLRYSEIRRCSRGPKAAREFEAQLIGAVLESLEKTFAAIPGRDAMPGEDDFNYLGTQALASAIAAGGGFGIAKMISEHFGDTHFGDTKVAPKWPTSPGSEPVSGR